MITFYVISKVIFYAILNDIIIIILFVKLKAISYVIPKTLTNI